MQSLLKRPEHPYLHPEAVLAMSHRDGCLSFSMSLIIPKALAQGQCEESLWL